MPGIKDKVPDFEEDKQLKVEDDCSSPYDFFLKFVDMQFLDMVEEKSKLYAVRKGAPEDVKYITKDNILTAVAIMHLTGYLTPYSRR